MWDGRVREGRLLQDTLGLSEPFYPDPFLSGTRQPLCVFVWQYRQPQVCLAHGNRLTSYQLKWKNGLIQNNAQQSSVLSCTQSTILVEFSVSLELSNEHPSRAHRSIKHLRMKYDLTTCLCIIPLLTLTDNSVPVCHASLYHCPGCLTPPSPQGE